MYTIILSEKKNYQAASDGSGYSFKMGKELARFTNLSTFEQYARTHKRQCRKAIALSGSASTMAAANRILGVL